MFKRTRFQLVALNTAVFVLLLNMFGAVLYFSTQQRLYSQVDQMLEREMSNYMRFFDRFSNGGRDFRPPDGGTGSNGSNGGGSHDREREFAYRPLPLMALFQWDEEQNLLRQFPADLMSETEQASLRDVLSETKIRTVSAGGNEYRVYSQPTSTGFVQMTYNLEPEKSVLDNLLLMMVAAELGSIVIAVLAGSFLANRSLIPIRRAWDQQQRFVSDASHELRTPLSVLQINLERLFRHPERTVEEESQKIAVLIDETRRMSKLVGELLELARSDTDQPQLAVADVDLPALADKVLHQFQGIAATKGVAMQLHTEGACVVRGDADRLQQLLVILLDNAVKYTKEGRITVSCARSGHSVRLTVADTGIGIGEADLPHIFDRFYRADKVRTRTEGGSGLGLSIAKSIVEAHRGSIQVESRLEEGTTVQLLLPAA